MPGNQAEKRAVSQIKPPRPTRTTRMCFSLRCGIIEKPWKSSLLRSCEPLHGGFVCQRTSCYLLRQRRRRFCSPWVGRDQGRRHCRWRSPDARNWLSFHDRYQYALSREAVRSTLRSSSKSAQRDSQSTLYEHNDNSKLTSHALKENRALTATAIQKVGPDRP